MGKRGYYAKCANCGRLQATQRDYVRHLLQEAGHNGITTNEFLRWGAGSRFGARVHELRHDEGLFITEENELYTLVEGVAASPAAVRAPVAGADFRVTGGTGRKTPSRNRQAWMCPRCAYREVDGPVCPRGHDAQSGWVIDLRTSEADAVEVAEAA